MLGVGRHDNRHARRDTTAGRSRAADVKYAPCEEFALSLGPPACN